MSFNNCLDNVVHNWVLGLPENPEARNVYFVRVQNGVQMYVTDGQGNPYLVAGGGSTPITLTSPNNTISILNQTEIDIAPEIIEAITAIVKFHNSFPDLQGGAPGEYFHLDDAKYAYITEMVSEDKIQDIYDLISTLQTSALSLGESDITAYRGDRGKMAYDHSLDVTTNPHNVTKAQVGLSDVDNTADIDKPVSTLQQITIDLKVQNNLTPSTSIAPSTTAVNNALSSKADLDINGKVPLSQINDALLGNVSYQGLYNVATNSPDLNTVQTKGKYYIISIAGTRFGLSFEIGDWIISNGSSWDKVDNTDAVSSVAGKTGVVTLVKSDVGLGNVDNTSDTSKPVSIPQQAALDTKQVVLVSGTNIKTIEGQSLLGSGNIDLSKSDVGLSNVDNTSDINKPVSTAQQTAIDAVAALDVPMLVTTSVNISTSSTWNNRIVEINNGVSNINLVVNDIINTAFLKLGTGTITITAGSGKTVYQSDSINQCNGIKGSTFLLTTDLIVANQVLLMVTNR